MSPTVKRRLHKAAISARRKMLDTIRPKFDDSRIFTVHRTHIAVAESAPAKGLLVLITSSDSQTKYPTGMQIESLTTEDLFQLAVRLGEAGRYAESRAMFQRLLELEPDNGAALREAAMINRREGRVSSAINLMRRALRVEPDNAEYWRDLGLSLRDGGNLPWAVASLVAAVACGRGRRQASGVRQALLEIAGLGSGGGGTGGQLGLLAPPKTVTWIRQQVGAAAALSENELAVSAVRTVQAYCKGRGLPYREVLPSTDLSLTIPSLIPEDTRQLSGTVQVPAAYVAEIPGAMMTNHRHLLVGEDGTVLTDRYASPRWKGRWNDWVDPSFGRTLAVLSTEKGRAALWKVGNLREAPVAECISLVAPTDVVWANWLAELLPRLMLLEKTPEYEGLPLLVNANLPRQAMEALALLNGGRRKVVGIDLHDRGRKGDAATPLVTYRFSRLIQPSSMAWYGPQTWNDGTSWALDDHVINLEGAAWLRSAVLAKVGRGKLQRIYISRARQPRRRVVNEAELLAVLKQRYGFSVVHPETLSFRAQATLFAGAEVVVGPVGSAFVNTRFCPPGAVVLPLVGDVLNTNYAPGILAHSAFGHDVRFLACDSVDGINMDFRVDIGQVVEGLEASGVTPRR